MVSTAEKLAEARALDRAETLLKSLIELSEVGSDSVAQSELRIVRLMLRTQVLWVAGSALAQNGFFEQAFDSLRSLFDYAAANKPEALPFAAKELVSRHLQLAISGCDRDKNLAAARDLVGLFDSWANVDTDGWVLYIRVFYELREYQRAMRGLEKLRTTIGAEDRIDGIKLRDLVAIYLLSKYQEAPAFRDRFGPFAAPIYAECTKTGLYEAWISVGNPKDEFRLPGRDGGQAAILIGQVVVYETNVSPSKRNPQVEVMLHEMVHLAARNGTTYKSEGTWYKARRDVPTAALATYVGRIQEFEADGIALPSSLDWLISFGRKSARDSSEMLHQQIANMLEYFEEIGEESNATYQCAAILSGILLEVLGPASSHEMQSYVWHLQLMSHELALERARRNVSVEL